MPKNKGIYKLFRTKQEFEHYEAEVRHFTRVFTLDDVTIALGRMDFREAKFREFDKVLAEVSHEYAHETLADYQDDKQMWYSKECKDRELKQYTGGLFVPWEERFR